MAGALGLAVTAFTVPFGPGSPEHFTAADAEAPLVIEEVPPTDMTPPPPPPALPPPPVAVPDDAEVEAIVEALDLRLDDELPPPPALPPAGRVAETPPIQPPPPPVLPLDLDPPAPPAPPVVEPETDRVFDVVEQQPELIDGLEGLQRRVEYPRLARDAGIQGRVFIQFVVDERGNVVDPVVTRTPSDLLSEAALKAVRASKFVPGSQRGRPVKVRYSLPVNFVLN